MINTNQLDTDLLAALKERFSPDQEKDREGAKGKKFKYISVHHVRERLEEVLGLYWNWEILETRAVSFFQKTKGKWNNQTRSFDLPPGAPEFTEVPGVVVTGRLTIHLPSGLTIFRDGNGGASADKGMGPGDAEKMAASNAFKRAAWKFGVGAYLGLDSDEAIDDVTYDQSYSKGGNSGFKQKPTAFKPQQGAVQQAAPQQAAGPVKKNPFVFRAS